MEMEDRYVPAGLFALLIPIVLMAHFMMSVQFSHQSGDYGTVHLMATINGSPAMRPIDWVVYCENQQRKPITRESRHAASASLKPDRYTAVAIYDGVQYEQAFTVSPGVTSKVFVPIDTAIN